LSALSGRIVGASALWYRKQTRDKPLLFGDVVKGDGQKQTSENLVIFNNYSKLNYINILN